MFVAQLIASALVWATVMVVMGKRREAIFARMTGLSRGRRIGLSVAALVASVAVLALGMGVLALGGLTPRGLTLWGWPTITLVGAIFVTLQTLALVPLVLNAATPVTRGEPRASDTVDADRP